MHVCILFSTFLVSALAFDCPYDVSQAADTFKKIMPVKEPTTPGGYPPISCEVVDFCSANGTKMLDWYINLFKECDGHPGLGEISFNPEQAKKTKSKCNEYYQEFKVSIFCMIDSEKRDEMQKCSDGIEITNLDQNPQLISCSVTAEQYNCLVTHVGADCGKQEVSLLISIWRTMTEKKYCTKTIDKEYDEPVNGGIQLKTSILATILVLAVSIML